MAFDPYGYGAPLQSSLEPPSADLEFDVNNPLLNAVMAAYRQQAAQAPQAPEEPAVRAEAPRRPATPSREPLIDPQSGLFNVPIGVGPGAEETARKFRDAAMGRQALPGSTGPIKNVQQLTDLIRSLQGVNPDLANAVIGRMTGIDPEARKRAQALEQQKALAQFNFNLNEPGRAETRAGLAAQRGIQNELIRQRQDLNAETRRMPSIPFKDANERVSALAESGLSREQLQQAAAAMGYELTDVVPTGGFLGMGQTPQPIMGPRRAGGTAPQTSQAPAGGAKQTEVVVEKGGQRFAISPDKLQAAIKRGYKLVQ